MEFSTRTAEERGPLADVDHMVITSLEVQRGGPTMSEVEEPPIPAGLCQSSRRHPSRPFKGTEPVAGGIGDSGRPLHQAREPDTSKAMAPITLETAIVLERITGMPASFWNRREADYREGLIRTKLTTLSEEDEAWLKSLPIKELQKRNKLPEETETRDVSSMLS